MSIRGDPEERKNERDVKEKENEREKREVHVLETDTTRVLLNRNSLPRPQPAHLSSISCFLVEVLASRRRSVRGLSAFLQP